MQFAKGCADTFNLDRNRISLFGDSAGGHLAALVALAGDLEPFRSAYPDDPHRHETVAVRS
ncbi:alpha/beta hydrolase fold domain-containing protein, partial [Klebsiella pneumoniae]|nr:alpha/beta hydrolase fold domain-containing protein [Klebsiella pneumoniae]